MRCALCVSLYKGLFMIVCKKKKRGKEGKESIMKACHCTHTALMLFQQASKDSMVQLNVSSVGL